MDEKRIKQGDMIAKIGTGVILAAVLGYILYTMLVVKPETIGIGYAIVIGLAVFAVWALNNVVVPLYTKEFLDRTPEQMNAFKLYALFELIGYGGLVYFVAAMDRQNGFYGALVYVGTMMLKRKYRDRYLGIEEDNDDEEAEEAQNGQEEQDRE